VPTNTSVPANTNTRTPINTPTNIPTNTSTNTATPANTNTRTPINTSTNTPINTSTRTPTNTATNPPASTPTATPTLGVCNGSHHYLDPEPGAPVNGGTVNVGDRFILDLKIDAGAYAAPDGLTAQQAYMTYTSQLLQNARVSSIGTSCVPTSTVTGD